MKKNRLFAAIICGALMLQGTTFTAMADATKVVTLGADLTDAQKQTMMNYFRANANEVQILTVTNQDERNHLGAYIPLAQIGTRTLSCAYVKPTTSGGIRVRTANLTYVTGNMIASTLSTSGVTNCEVIAACPFEVSGTGALTGIQMAYERASGTVLDPVKTDLAAQEIVVTGNVASEVGNNNATMLINAAKIEVIQNNVQNTQEIYNIVNNICIQNNIVLPEQNVVEVVDLLSDISEQDYDYEEMSATLELVDDNVNKVSEIDEGESLELELMESGPVESEEGEIQIVERELDEDSILNDIDETMLGEEVPVSSTDDPSLEVSTYDASIELGKVDASTEETAEDSWSEFGIPEAEEFVVNPDGTTEQYSGAEYPDAEYPGAEYPDAEYPAQEEYNQEIPADSQDAENWETYENPGNEESTEWQEATGQEEISEQEAIPEQQGSADTAEALKQQKIAALSEEKKTRYNEVLDFCKVEFENDTQVMVPVLGGDYRPSYLFADTELAKKLSAEISDQYLDILSMDPAAYLPTAGDTYISPEMNEVSRYLRALFGIEAAQDPAMAGAAADNSLLMNISDADKALLYQDCLSFFEKLYGEAAPVQTEQQSSENSEKTGGSEEEQGFGYYDNNGNWVSFPVEEQEYSSENPEYYPEEYSDDGSYDYGGEDYGYEDSPAFGTGTATGEYDEYGNWVPFY